MSNLSNLLTKLISVLRQEPTEDISIKNWANLSNDAKAQKRLLKKYYKHILFDEKNSQKTDPYLLDEFLKATTESLKLDVFKRYVSDVLKSDANRKGNINFFTLMIANLKEIPPYNGEKAFEFLLDKIKENSANINSYMDFERLSITLEKNDLYISKFKKVYETLFSMAAFKNYSTFFGRNLITEKAVPLASVSLLDIMECFYNSQSNLKKDGNLFLPPLRDKDGNLNIDIQTLYMYLETLNLHGKIDITRLDTELLDALSSSLQKEVQSGFLTPFSAYGYLVLLGNNEHSRDIVNANIDVLFNKLTPHFEQKVEDLSGDLRLKKIFNFDKNETPQNNSRLDLRDNVDLLAQYIRNVDVNNKVAIKLITKFLGQNPNGEAITSGCALALIEKLREANIGETSIPMLLNRVNLNFYLMRGFLKNFNREDHVLTDAVIKYIQNGINSQQEWAKQDAGCYILNLSKNQTTRMVVEENMETLMSWTDSPLTVKAAMGKYFSQRADVRKGINANFDGIFYEIFPKEFSQEDTFILRKVLEEILKQENVELADIEYLSHGTFSKVYSIGDKVLKVSKKEITNDRITENSERFIQPLFRRKFKAFEPDGKVTICSVEIQEKVKMLSKVSDEKLYEIYRNLRAQGMLWTDIRSNNVGQLLKDNKIYFDGIRQPTEGEKHIYGPNLGFEKDKECGRILPAGEFVVIDLDFIYQLPPDQMLTPEIVRSSNIEIPRTAYDYIDDFEDQYLSERKAQKNDKNVDVSNSEIDF